MTKTRLWASDTGLPINFWIARIARKLQINLNWVFDPKTSLARRYPFRLGSSTTTTRRAFIAALPAFGATLTYAGKTEAAEASPLRELYHQWQGAKEAFANLPDDTPEEVDEIFFQEIDRLEQEAERFEPVTIEDLAFKIIFADDNGDMTCNVHAEALASKAYAMVGILQSER